MYKALNSDELAALKVGDRVVVGAFRGPYVVATVIRVTSTQLVVRDTGDYRYSRKQGHRLGDGSQLYGRKKLFRADDAALIEIAKTERIARIISKVYAMEKLMPAYRKRIEYGKGTTDELSEIEHYVNEAYSKILSIAGGTQ